MPRDRVRRRPGDGEALVDRPALNGDGRPVDMDHLDRAERSCVVAQRLDGAWAAGDDPHVLHVEEHAGHADSVRRLIADRGGELLAHERLGRVARSVFSDVERGDFGGGKEREAVLQITAGPPHALVVHAEHEHAAGRDPLPQRRQPGCEPMPRQVGEERRDEYDVEALSAREVGRIGGRSQSLNAELFGQEGERISLDLADRHGAGGQALHEETRAAAISRGKIQERSDALEPAEAPLGDPLDQRDHHRAGAEVVAGGTSPEGSQVD